MSGKKIIEGLQAAINGDYTVVREGAPMTTDLTHPENVLKNTADVNMPARLGSTICVGRPTIERLALDGAVCFPDGTTLSAADDLYQNNPFDVIAKLTAERDMLLRREAETIARYDAKLDTAERERDEARADRADWCMRALTAEAALATARAEGVREGMEKAAGIASGIVENAMQSRLEDESVGFQIEAAILAAIPK